MTRPRLQATPAIRKAAVEADVAQWLRGPTKRERYQRTHSLLVRRYRRVFARARPLAIGIDQQIRAAVREDELSTRALGEFLKTWIRRPPYQAALDRGVRRVNLDGSDAGPAIADLKNQASDRRKARAEAAE